MMTINVVEFVKRHSVLVGLVTIIIGSGLVFAMSDIYVSGAWRYKITIEVETPEGVKSGSSVYEMSNTDSNIKIIDFPESGNPASVRGEAVVVDLGKRGIVFAIIPPEYLLYSVFPVPGGGETTPKGIRYYKNLKDVKATLKQSQYPTLVTFKDIKDPKSVELVYQSQAISVPNQADYDFKITDNLKRLFGAGVKLKDITIEMTDEPVTWRIEKYLNWLTEIESKKARLNGNTSIAILTNELPDNLGAGSFRVRR